MNIDVTGNEKREFSRRRVVKGVAWSVPVLVAAVGAPPAAASPGPVTPPAFTVASGPLGMVDIPKQQGSGNLRRGQVPAYLVLENNTGGTLTGTIGITSTVNSGTARLGLAVRTLENAAVGTTSFDANYVSTATFSITGTQSTNRLVSFYHVEGTGQAKPASGQIYTFAVTFTVGSTSVVLPISPTLTIA